MHSISNVEIWSLLNLLKEIRDGSEPSDLEQDIEDMIEMLDAILEDGRMNIIGRNGNTGGHYE